MVCLIGFVLILLFVGIVFGVIVQDYCCLIGGCNDSIYLEWCWLEDGVVDVCYVGQCGCLFLCWVLMEIMVLVEDCFYQFDSVWEECIDGCFNGCYLLSIQGVLVLDLSYECVCDGCRIFFYDDVEVWQEDGCYWFVMF